MSEVLRLRLGEGYWGKGRPLLAFAQDDGFAGRIISGEAGWVLRLRPARRDFPFDFAALAQGDDLRRGCAAEKAQNDEGFGAEWLLMM
jgi:hypothetical protein